MEQEHFPAALGFAIDIWHPSKRHKQTKITCFGLKLSMAFPRKCWRAVSTEQTDVFVVVHITQRISILQERKALEEKRSAVRRKITDNLSAKWNVPSTRRIQTTMGRARVGHNSVALRKHGFWS